MLSRFNKHLNAKKYSITPQKTTQYLPYWGAFMICASVLCTSDRTNFFLQQAYANDEVFNLAYRDSDNVEAMDQYKAQLQGSSLQYYPDYWKLRKNLANQPASNIIAFNQSYPNSAMAEKLTADYVEEKVKRNDFSSAMQAIPYISNPDLEESCAIAYARTQSGDDFAIVELKNEIWLQTEDEPKPPCASLIYRMNDNPLISQSDKQQRLFVLLRAGKLNQASTVATHMGLRLDYNQMTRIVANPQMYLSTASKNTSEDMAYLILAMGRLAAQNLPLAINMVDRVAQNTPTDVQKYLYRTVAYIGGTSVVKNNFNANIPTLFDKSYGYPMGYEEAEIYARQAIRFSRWDSVVRAVRAMPIKQQQDSRWQYWLARALEQQGDRHQAQQIYQKLAQKDDYHGILAYQRLGKNYTPSSRDYQPTSQDFSRLAQDIHFRRAFSLYGINAPVDYVNREWNWAVRQAYLKQDDGLLIAAATRAKDIGWYDRAIYAAERTIRQHNYALRYPTPYQNMVINYSHTAGVSPAWAYGVIRQESRFNVNARSSVGAMGLMQIMPSTGKEIARYFGDGYHSNSLKNINTNIRYGTYYLGKIQGQLSGHPILATAGYNAGLSRARKWQPNHSRLEADQYIESIPLKETRGYVKNIMNNVIHYGAMLGKSQNIMQFMYAIPANNNE